MGEFYVYLQILMLDFYKLMVDKDNGCTVLGEFTHLAQARVLDIILRDCRNKDVLTWYFTSDNVEEVCYMLGISKSYLKRVLRELKELGILNKQARGVYMVSKKYFQALL